MVNASSSTPPPDPPTIVYVYARPRPLWHLALVIVAPWFVIAGFVLRWLFLLLLTGVGMAVALIGCLVWLIGRAIAVRWPDAGRELANLGGPGSRRPISLTSLAPPVPVSSHRPRAPIRRTPGASF